MQGACYGPEVQSSDVKMIVKIMYLNEMNITLRSFSKHMADFYSIFFYFKQPLK